MVPPTPAPLSAAPADALMPYTIPSKAAGLFGPVPNVQWMYCEEFRDTHYTTRAQVDRCQHQPHYPLSHGLRDNNCKVLQHGASGVLDANLNILGAV